MRDALRFRHCLESAKDCRRFEPCLTCWVAIGYTAAHWVLVVLIYLWIAQAFGSAFRHSEMNFSGAMLLLAVTLVGSVLQLPGIGRRRADRQHYGADDNLWGGAGAGRRHRGRAVDHLRLPAARWPEFRC